MKPTDFLGRNIRRGDMIFYPARRGSAMSMNKLSVQEIADEYVVGYNPLGRRVKITNLKNVVVVPPGSREAM